MKTDELLRNSYAPVGPPSEEVDLVDPAAGVELVAKRRARRSQTSGAWSNGWRCLYVSESGRLPAHIFRVEIRGGRRELWKEIMPSDPSGVHTISDAQVTRDARSYAYSYFRKLGGLYLVDGLR
jgi:hypothetical protein